MLWRVVWRGLLRRSKGVDTRWLSNASRPNPKDRFVYPEGITPYEEDYVEEPDYPEIDPETHQWTEHQRKRRQDVLDFHKRIRDAPNPEAKTVAMNKPRQYGWRCTMLDEDLFEYDSDMMYKFVTRSHLVENVLPDVYSDPGLTEMAKYYTKKLAQPVLEALKYELSEQRRSYEDDLGITEKTADFRRSVSVISQLNRIILSVLGKDVEHLNNCRVDVEPNINAFWFNGGHMPSNVQRVGRKAAMEYPHQKKFKGNVDDPVERMMKYKGSPLLQIRCENPISNFVAEDSPLCSYPEDGPQRFPYHLAHFNVHKDFDYAGLVPGTWTGDSHKCSHIAFHARHHLRDQSAKMSKYWLEDAENMLSSQMVLASFGRLLSQALYFGFDQFSELNYPFSSQTIVTDGVQWSFSAYQLNTIRLDDLHLKKNNKQNICWKLQTMSILNKDDSEKLDLNTLETLLKFYLNKPSPIPVDHPTPYNKVPLQEWDDEIQREIIFFNYRDMVANRWKMMDIFNRLYPEIYNWEWIYKIKHKQRYMEPRRRFFEFPDGFPGRNPYDTPYALVDPRRVGKRMKQMMQEVAEKKERERIEAAKRAESAKYGIIDEDPSLKKKR